MKTTVKTIEKQNKKAIVEKQKKRLLLSAVSTN